MSKKDFRENIKRLVFRKRDSIEEALEYSKCQIFHDKLLAEQGQAKADDQTLRLYNDAVWVACGEIISISFKTIESFSNAKSPSYYYSWQDVLDLAREIPHKIPTMRVSANRCNKPMDTFAVSYLPYGEWGDTIYTPYDVTGFLSMPLVERLYETTVDEDDRLELLHEIKEDVSTYYASDEDLLFEEVWVWACAREALIWKNKSKRSKEPIFKYIEENTPNPNATKRKYQTVLDKLRKSGSVGFQEDGTIKLIKWERSDLRYFIETFFKKLIGKNVNKENVPTRIFRETFRNKKGVLFSDMADNALNKVNAANAKFKSEIDLLFKPF